MARYKSKNKPQENLSILQEFQNIGHKYECLLPIVNRYYNIIAFEEDENENKILTYSAPNKPIQRYIRELTYGGWGGYPINIRKEYYYPFDAPYRLMHQAMLQKMGIRVVIKNQYMVTEARIGIRDEHDAIVQWGNPRYSSLEDSRPALDENIVFEHTSQLPNLDVVSYHPGGVFDPYFAGAAIATVDLNYIDGFAPTVPSSIKQFYENPHYFAVISGDILPIEEQRQSIFKWNINDRDYLKQRILIINNAEFLALYPSYIIDNGSNVHTEESILEDIEDYLHRMNSITPLSHLIPGKVIEITTINLYSWRRHLVRTFLGTIIYNEGTSQEYTMYQHRTIITWTLESIGNELEKIWTYYPIIAHSNSSNLNYQGNIEAELADIVTDIDELGLIDMPLGQVVPVQSITYP